MASGYKSKRKDLDEIFEPIPAGATPARNAGMTTGASNTDLSQIYCPLSLGSQAPATGIVSSGSDLNTLYCAKGSSVLQLHITASHTNLNLRTWADGQTGNSYPYSAINIYVDTGVVLDGLTESGVFPIPLTVVNNGAIYGAGGAGGVNAWDADGTGSKRLPSDGSAGGDAFSVQMSLHIQNSGKIYGGGGGGAGLSDADQTNYPWRYVCSTPDGTWSYGPGSGGGQGSPGGVKGTLHAVICSIPAQAYGTDGSVSQAGSAGLLPNGASTPGGQGDGGTWGNAGVSSYHAGTVGGAPGKAVAYNGYSVTWIGSKGDVRGVTA